jgi:UvrB/uvrC motif
MKVKRVKIQSEHYPNEVDLTSIAIDTVSSRRVIEHLTGLSYMDGKFTKPSQVVDFVQKVLNAEYSYLLEGELVRAVKIVLAVEIAEIINGKPYFANKAGVGIEPNPVVFDVWGSIPDYVVYCRTPNGDFVYETDKIIEHFLAGGEDYSQFIVGVVPVRRKRVPKKGVATRPKKANLQVQLKKAITVENYERAAELRDLLKKI